MACYTGVILKQSSLYVKMSLIATFTSEGRESQHAWFEIRQKIKFNVTLRPYGFFSVPHV